MTRRMRESESSRRRLTRRTVESASSRRRLTRRMLESASLRRRLTRRVLVSYYVRVKTTSEFCQRLHLLHERLGVNSSRVESNSIQLKIQSHALYVRLLQKQGTGALRLDFKLSCVLSTTQKPRNTVDPPPTPQNHISYSVINYPEILEGSCKR